MAESSQLQGLNIHGVREILVYRSWIRFVWLAVVLTALAMMFRQCLKLTVDLSSEPIVTYAKNYEREESFPSVMICPMLFKYRKHHESNFFFNSTHTFKRHGDGVIFPDNLVQGEGSSQNQFWEKWNNLNLITEYMEDQSWAKSHDLILMMMDSFEPLNYVRVDSHQSTSGTTVQAVITEDSWDKVYDFFWEEYLGPNKSLAEKQLENSVDFDTLIREVDGYSLINKRKIYTGYGVCYAFDFLQTNPSTLHSKILDVKFALRRPPHELQRFTTMDTLGEHINADYMFIGDTSFWPKSSHIPIPQAFQSVPDQTGLHPAATGVFVRPIDQTVWMDTRVDYDMTLLVSSVTFNRLNLRRRPCRDWSEQDRSICMVQCYNDEFCSKMEHRPCLMYHPNQTEEEQFKKLCSTITGQLFYITQKMDTCIYQAWLHPERSWYDEKCENRCPKVYLCWSIQSSPYRKTLLQLCYERVYYFTHEQRESTTYYHPSLAILVLYQTLFSLKDAKTRTYDVTHLGASEGWFGDLGDGERWHDWSNFGVIIEKTYWANITLRFQDSMKRFQLNEQLGVTNYAFAAHFGSAITLWTGASGLAIAELVVMVCAGLFCKSLSRTNHGTLQYSRDHRPHT